jgi:hypothetical protein
MNWIIPPRLVCRVKGHQDVIASFIDWESFSSTMAIAAMVGAPTVATMAGRMRCNRCYAEVPVPSRVTRCTDEILISSVGPGYVVEEMRLGREVAAPGMKMTIGSVSEGAIKALLS